MKIITAIFAGICLPLSISASAKRITYHSTVVPFELKGFKLGSPLSELKARYPSVLCEDQSALKPEYRTMKSGDANCWQRAKSESDPNELLHFVGNPIPASAIYFAYHQNVLDQVRATLRSEMYPDIAHALIKKYGQPTKRLTARSSDGSIDHALWWINDTQEIVIHENNEAETELEQVIFHNPHRQMSISVSTFSYLSRLNAESKRQQDKKDQQI